VERAFGNPLDTVGLPRLRRDGNIRAVVQAMLEDNGIDVIGLVLGMRADGWESHQELVDHMAAAAQGARKPLLVVSFMSNGLTRHWRGFTRARGLPLVEDLERGLQAVRHLVDYAEFRRRAEQSVSIAHAGASAAKPERELANSAREAIAILPRGVTLSE